MTAELGVFFIIMALLLALLQGFYSIGRQGFKAASPSFFPAASLLQALFVSLALASLVTLRLNSDFSVAGVVAHSNLSLPTIYKITGSWGYHEGSMLLWVWVLAFFGAIFAGSSVEAEFKCKVLSVQSLLSAGFLAFILATSNPFARQFPPPTDGQALNPILQDIALAMHPPLLYVGYVGFSLVFSLALAGLWQRRLGAEWAAVAHPWIIAAWSALTLGIGLGSWWAYRALGWGGWWFWDPVENASLLPWLAATALLHSNMVLKKRGQLASWVALLSIITFALSLLGTFLVRSGVLTSVHSFASDPARGYFILAYMVVAIGGGLWLFSARAGSLGAGSKSLQPASREGLIVINNLLLLTACATVLLGTLYPMMSETLTGKKISVGAPYFIITFTPTMAMALFLAGFGLLVPWRQAHLRRSLKLAVPGMLAAVAAVVVVVAIALPQQLLAITGFGVGAWLGVSSIHWYVKQKNRLGTLPAFLAHVGAAILVVGITSAGLYKQESDGLLSVGDQFTQGGYEVTLKTITETKAPNYKTRIGEFEVSHGQQLVVNLTPELRTYDIRGSTTSQAAIYSAWFSDVYLVVGDAASEGNQLGTRLYYHPLVWLLWIGCAAMALGGMTAVFIRKKATRDD